MRKLSKREREIAALLAQGLSTKSGCGQTVHSGGNAIPASCEYAKSLGIKQLS
jgi:hypothetical protein